ncbi:SGNH/GDSL hydrolase family protein [Qipengyuania sp.]|uniref:SGNH/GDSL hydrolase family protein n=1 Tax=Qipengyuania sp. TaxID=2004515 RepID=UPI003AF8DBB8
MLRPSALWRTRFSRGVSRPSNHFTNSARSTHLDLCRRPSGFSYGAIAEHGFVAPLDKECRKMKGRLFLKHTGLRKVLFVACLLLCASCAAPGMPPGTAPPPGTKYVALGSSFAAGAGIGPLQPGAPERCGRTANNYASLLAEALDLRLVDASCGGATTSHVLGSWNELAPQIAEVDAETRLVTITIGGNDLNYIGDLFMASCMASKRGVEAGAEKPCASPTWPTDEDYTNVQSALEAIALAVRESAPAARIVFVQYVSLVPDRPCDSTAMPAGYAVRTRRIGRRLAEATVRAAEAAQVEVFPADRLSREHTACAPVPWAKGGTATVGDQPGAPWHPNALGHREIAAALATMLR